jgi:hypothetical protein
LIRWRLTVLASTAALGLSLSACQSTQDKAKEIQERAVAAAPKPLVIPKPNRDVSITSTALLHDPRYGDAIVVGLRNNSNQTLVNLPILVTITDQKGRTAYKNDTAGLEPSLNHLALLKPHESFYWVNDQVEQGTKAKVEVGEPEGKAPNAPAPELQISDPRLGSDFSGPRVTGTVTNRSKIDQQKLILYAVARQGGKIVAAGKGQIKALKTSAKPGPYKIYFIGDPSGADVTVEAPPTTLQGSGG